MDYEFEQKLAIQDAEEEKIKRCESCGGELSNASFSHNFGTQEVWECDNEDCEPRPRRTNPIDDSPSVPLSELGSDVQMTETGHVNLMAFIRGTGV